LARTWDGWADALLARGGDPERAREMLRKAVALAREHEVPELERRAAERLEASASSIA